MAHKVGEDLSIQAAHQSVKENTIAFTGFQLIFIIACAIVGSFIISQFMLLVLK